MIYHRPIFLPMTRVGEIHVLSIYYLGSKFGSNLIKVSGTREVMYLKGVEEGKILDY